MYTLLINKVHLTFIIFFKYVVSYRIEEVFIPVNNYVNNLHSNEQVLIYTARKSKESLKPSHKQHAQERSNNLIPGLISVQKLISSPSACRRNILKNDLITC
ncbi:membrane associated guanylate kinase inverted related [Schistosoma mansoni]|uniref:membrane associated guanylate kinase inverted related n=1 Tax=Schistosoma mansoni TaxID=6183 RepID=UPI00022C830E|nr:membrane associated guanylate kinase inverted related [Schistosoma mansoni]|eukprot:XP_018644904.1 membrane associated guanylate kinase inverted related [Schistosoma mansoni]